MPEGVGYGSKTKTKRKRPQALTPEEIGEKFHGKTKEKPKPKPKKTKEKPKKKEAPKRERPKALTPKEIEKKFHGKHQVDNPPPKTSIKSLSKEQADKDAIRTRALVKGRKRFVFEKGARDNANAKADSHRKDLERLKRVAEAKKQRRSAKKRHSVVGDIMRDFSADINKSGILKTQKDKDGAISVVPKKKKADKTYKKRRRDKDKN